MAFTLYTDADGSYTNFRDGDKYYFNDQGLLVTKLSDGTRNIWSPNAWHHIEDTLTPPAVPIGVVSV